MSLDFYIKCKLFSSSKGFELGSKLLYHNGRLGAEADFDKIKNIIEVINNGRYELNIYLKNKYTIVVFKKNYENGVDNMVVSVPVLVGKKKSQQKVYLISGANYMKIGVAKSVNSRLKQLQTANPSKLEIMFTYSPVNANATDIERKLHQHFKQFRVEGEWFKMDISLENFKELCENFDKP